MNIQKCMKIYVIPAAVCQSVVVGGGYGTGREVVEFVSGNGAWGGLASLLVYAVLVSLIIAVSFEFARSFRVYDYRAFSRELIGRGWVLYEIFVIAALLLVLSVTGSAAAAILYNSFGIAKPIGVGLVLVSVVVLSYYGRAIIEYTLTAWAIILTCVLTFYAAYIITFQHEAIASTFSDSTLHSGWMISGLQFGLNNSGLFPLLLYVAVDIETRKQAILSGLIAGLSITFPGIAFHLTFMAAYPSVLEQALPTYWMIREMTVPFFLPIYVIVLFGTITQTGVGILQGLQDRLNGSFLEITGRPLTPVLRGTVSGIALLLSIGLANLGVIFLIAQGYGNAAWISLLFFQAPLLTVGLFKLFHLNQIKGS